MIIRPALHGAFLIYVLFCISLVGCSDDKLSKDVSAINSRLEKIETRLVNIEKSAKRTSILEVELRKMQQSMEAWERAITARLKPGELKKKTASAKSTKESSKNKNSKTRYYTVKKGDSIYAIASKYGMTTDELCKLNKIDVKTILHPGQRLLVF